jgi:hypothetical protein
MAGVRKSSSIPDGPFVLSPDLLEALVDLVPALLIY